MVVHTIVKSRLHRDDNMIARQRMFAFWLACSLTLPASASVTIRYPLLATISDPQQSYMLAMLKLACQKSGQRCVLKPATAMVQSRAILQLQKPGSHIDLLWTMTSRERERQLRPIRIPLYKGLVGWRVALLGKGRSQLLANVHTLQDLKTFRAGQEHDWPDVRILRASGLAVETSSDYESLFGMLNEQRFDYLPRSVIEIKHEYQARLISDITIDRHILIHYPAAFYFFVAKNNRKLAQLLETGLERAVADGSFDRLFQQYHGEALRSLQLGKRRVIHLSNPLLPPQTPLHRKALWYAP